MSIKPIWYFSFVEVKYEQSGAYGCSWLTSWWEKGFFYSPCSPCSEHNRVPHTHYLITSKNRFLRISSTRNLQRERPTFFFFFPCQLCLKQCHILSNSWTAFLLSSLHKEMATQISGPWGHQRPYCSCPAFAGSTWGQKPHFSLISVLGSFLYIAALFYPVSCVLSFSSWWELLDGPWPLSLPCQGPLADFVTAIVSAHHSHSLWGSIPWRARGLCWSHPQDPACAPLGRAVPHWGNRLWQYRSGKMMAMNHLHLAVFLCSGSKEHPWLCATWTENICLSLLCGGGFAQEQGGRDGTQTPSSSCFRAI